MTDLATRLRDAASRIGFYNGKGQWEPGALSVIVEAADYIDNSVEATLRIRAEDRLAAAERALREIAEWSGPGDWTDLLKRMAREALPVAYSSEPQHTRWADLKAKRGLLSKEEREKRKTGPRLSDLNSSDRPRLRCPYHDGYIDEHDKDGGCPGNARFADRKEE